MKEEALSLMKHSSANHDASSCICIAGMSNYVKLTSRDRYPSVW